MITTEICVGFSTTNKLLSRIIRWFTGSQVSHTFLCFDWKFSDGAKIPMVLEASFEGLRMVPFERFLTQSKLVALLPLNGVTLGQLKPLLERLGTPYDAGGLVGNIIVRMGAFFKKAWKNPIADKNALFCSEAVVEVLQNIGYPRADSLVASDTTPQDLLLFLQSK
jgi:hypothetical protein